MLRTKGSGAFVWIVRAAALAVAAALPLAWTGCSARQDASAASSKEDQKPEEEKKKDKPKVAGLDGLGETASESLINDEAQGPAVPQYVSDHDWAMGSLGGVCVLLVNDDGKLKEEKTIDLDGKDKIAEPKEGEVDYYKNIKLKEKLSSMLYWDRGAKNYRINGAVLKLLGVKAGARDALIRAGVTIQKGHMDQWGHFGHRFGSIIAPVRDRIQFQTFDKFDCEMCVEDASGKKLFECAVKAWTVTKETEGWGWKVPAPEAAIGEVIPEVGIYHLRCKRHPWQTGAIHAVDNPYAHVVWDSKKETYGTFNFPDVPPGTYTLEVWHPYFKPKQKTIEVEIKKNSKQEVRIEFTSGLARPDARQAAA